MKTLVFVGVLMVSAAGGAAGAGLNIAWDDCLGSGYGVSNKNVACTTVGGYSLHLSFVVPQAIPQLQTSEALVDIQSGAPMLGSWWLDGTTRFGVNAALGISSCPGWYDAAAGGPIVSTPVFTQLSPYRLRIGMVVSVAPGEEQNIPLDGTEWLANTLRLKFNSGTLNNPDCMTSTCFTFYRLTLEQTGGGLPTVLDSPDISSYATWQGVIGIPCPPAVPTKVATWGSIKALYR